MKVLMICGVFAKENQQEVIDQSRGAVDFSANLFQQKLIGGFLDTDCELSVLSAPFIGAFPVTSHSVSFKGFSTKQDTCRYVKFNNIWGLRNLSRAAALKRGVRDFIEVSGEQKMIVVYCAHTPFLEAAAYAKKKDPSIRVCLMVPDLPEYMNLRSDRSWFYDFAKKFDIAKMHKLMTCVDSFVLLTEQMKNALPVGNKPYRVVEGIIPGLPERVEVGNSTEREKYIVYTGKMDAAFGVRALVDAMGLLDDPDYRLVLCGRGDSYDYAAAAAQKDERIMALGQVSPEDAAKWQRRAAVLINPRANVGEYTKYSFPSKNIEYLLMGKPVAAYMLDGMPACYREFLFAIDEMMPAAHAIKTAVEQAVVSEAAVKEKKYKLFLEYAAGRLCASQVAQGMMDITN